MTQTKSAWYKALSVLLCCALCLTSYVFFVPSANAIVYNGGASVQKADKYGTPIWNDSEIENTANSNCRWAQWWVSSGKWVQVNYPKHMYLDVSETLQSAGYSMKFTWNYGNIGGGNYRIVAGGAIWGDNDQFSSGGAKPGTFTTMTDHFSNYRVDASLATDVDGLTDGENDVAFYEQNWNPPYANAETLIWVSKSAKDHTAYVYFQGTPTNQTGTFTYSTSGVSGDEVKCIWFQGRSWGSWGDDGQYTKPTGVSDWVDASHQSNNYTEIFWDVTIYNKSALNSEIQKAEAFQAAFSQHKDHLVAGDWSAFESALAEAKRLLITREVEQQQLDNAQTALRNAGNALKFNVNASALQSAMADAEAKLGEADLADRYTSDSISALQTALNEAKAYSTPSDWNPYPNNSTAGEFNAKATELTSEQADVDALAAALKEALDDLLGRADFSAYEQDLQKNPVTGECYSADTWSDYNVAKTAVETLRADANVSVNQQDEVNVAIEAYIAARKALKEQHTFTGEYTTVTEATCTESGLKTRQCSKCIAVEEVEIPPLGHEQGGVVNQFAGNCTEKAYIEYQCTRCQVTYRVEGEVNPDVHNWDAGVITTPATCRNDGVKTYTCQDCQKTKTESIPAGEEYHRKSETPEHQEATCTEYGQNIYKCIYCGMVMETETIESEPPVPHDYDYSNSVASTDGNCVTKATATYQCKNCEATTVVEGEVNPAIHSGPEVQADADDPEKGVEAYKPATCQQAGHEADTICNACGALIEKGKEIPINPDAHTFTFSETIAPTCTEAGYDLYVCACDAQEMRNPVDATGHSWAQKESVEANCQQGGYELWVCSVCQEQEKRNETPVEETKHVGEAVLDEDTIYYPDDCTAKNYNTGDSYYSGCGHPASSGEKEKYASHAWSAEGEEQPDGSVVYHCTHKGCQVTNVVSHTHTGGKATCVSPAICETCGASYGAVDSSNHADVVAIEALPATCTTAGHEAGEKCNACGVVLSGLAEIPALGHDFDHNNPAKMEVIQEGTCSAKEVIRYFCNRCDDATDYQDVVGDYNPDNHVNTIETEAIAPTCTTAGYTAGVYCNDCGQYVSGHELIPALGHNYDSATHTEIETAATCSKPATLRVYCVNCDESYIIMEDPEGALNPDNHVNTVNTPAVDATCTTDGYTAGVYCNDCGQYVSGHEVIPASGHKTEWVVVSGSCTEGVVRELRCTVCGEVFERETLPATGHQIGEWTIVSEATCTEPGLRQAVCSVCGEAVTEVIPATGHVYDDGVLILHPEDSETGVGLMRYTCTKCGDQMDKEITDTGHIHHGGTATCVSRAVCVECGREYGDYDANNHAHIIAIPDADPTCETAGHTGGTYCDACGVVVTPATETAPATGHVDENGDGICDIDGKPILPEDPDDPDEPEDPENPDDPDGDDHDEDSIWGGFRCKMCDIYEANKDIPVIGFFYMIVHFFVHIINYIKYIT